MKIGIISESPADAAVLEILLNALTHRTHTILPNAVRQRPGGWHGVISAIRAELTNLHYRTDAGGMIAVVDSDDSPLHDDSHEAPHSPQPNCRVCQIIKDINDTRQKLKGRPVNSVNVAVGLAVPALEAWLLFDQDPHIAEARYERDLATGVNLKNARMDLKRRLYRTTAPQRHVELDIATQAANRISLDLAALETAFPKGFGRFARQIRSW